MVYTRKGTGTQQVNFDFTNFYRSNEIHIRFRFWSVIFKAWLILREVSLMLVYLIWNLMLYFDIKNGTFYFFALSHLISSEFQSRSSQHQSHLITTISSFNLPISKLQLSSISFERLKLVECKSFHIKSWLPRGHCEVLCAKFSACPAGGLWDKLVWRSTQAAAFEEKETWWRLFFPVTI